MVRDMAIDRGELWPYGEFNPIFIYVDIFTLYIGGFFYYLMKILGVIFYYFLRCPISVKIMMVSY